MDTVNKNTDPKALSKLFGDGDFTEFFNFDAKTHVITFLPPSDKKFPKNYHWHHLPKKQVQTYVECMRKPTCLIWICEALKPTKWLSKLWN